MSLMIDLQNHSNCEVPTKSQIQQWITATLKITNPKILDSNKGVTIRFIDKEESANLNETFRKKPSATNVLSFPDDPIPGFEETNLGDIALCAPLIIEEAQQQSKTIKAHFAHLTIHAILHLLDYDHVDPQQATAMETLEIKILSHLGYPNPYIE